ncbi:MAG TPA: hypothetical protein VLM89_00235 [Phycisphaerae bacterium]|nr:hypothetical protein [Phycisphaerae bacterium]
MCSFRPVVVWAAVLFSTNGLVSAQTTQPSDRAWMIQRFDQQFLPQIRQSLSQPIDNGSGGIAWGHSYQLAALVEMLEATADPKYAEAFVELAKAVIQARDDRHDRQDQLRNRVVKGWGSVKYSGNRHFVWAVHTGMIIEPMARFYPVVNSDPRLQASFRADAVAFLQVAIESDAVHDDEFRQGPGPDEGYLFGLFLNKHLPLNQQNALARAWLWLADATGDPKYLDKARRLAAFFKKRIRTTDDGAYVWEYWPPLDGAGDGFEDVSHAAINADFLVRCAERGIVFDAADVTRLEKTFLARVLPDPQTVSDTLAGADGTSRYRYAPFFWARLAQHNPVVRERLLAFCRFGAADRTCSPSEALGLAMLVRAVSQSQAAPESATQPAIQPTTQPNTAPAGTR